MEKWETGNELSDLGNGFHSEKQGDLGNGPVSEDKKPDVKHEFCSKFEKELTCRGYLPEDLEKAEKELTKHIIKEQKRDKKIEKICSFIKKQIIIYVTSSENYVETSRNYIKSQKIDAKNDGFYFLDEAIIEMVQKECNKNDCLAAYRIGENEIKAIYEEVKEEWKKVRKERLAEARKEIERAIKDDERKKGKINPFSSAKTDLLEAIIFELTKKRKGHYIYFDINDEIIKKIYNKILQENRKKLRESSDIKNLFP